MILIDESMFLPIDKDIWNTERSFTHNLRPCLVFEFRDCLYIHVSSAKYGSRAYKKLYPVEQTIVDGEFIYQEIPKAEYLEIQHSKQIEEIRQLKGCFGQDFSRFLKI